VISKKSEIILKPEKSSDNIKFSQDKIRKLIIRMKQFKRRTRRFKKKKNFLKAIWASLYY